MLHLRPFLGRFKDFDRLPAFGMLPEPGHSPNGIISSSLDLRPTAFVTFTPEQAAAIRERVTSAN